MLTPYMQIAQHQSIKAMTNTVNTEFFEHIRKQSKFFTPRPSVVVSPANKYDLPTNPFICQHFQLTIFALCFCRLVFDIKTKAEYSFQGSDRRGSGLKPGQPETSSKATPKTRKPQGTLAVPVLVDKKDVEQSLDMRVSRAEKFFYMGEYKKSMQLLET